MSTGTRILSAIAGVLWAAIGVFFLIYPLSSTLAAAFFVAIMFIIMGIVQIIAFASVPKGTQNRGWVLAEGIIGIIVGILMLWEPAAGALSMVWILGFALMFVGIVRIAGSFTAKKAGMSNWWLILILGILGVLLSFLVFYAPLSTFAIFVAVGLIIYGIGDIVSAIIGKDIQTIE